MASIQINRGTTTEIENTPYRDGLISFDTDKKEILMDNNGERETYGANGTEVTANPEGQATGDLQKLGIGEDIYNVSGGHTIQNTSGTAVTQRTKMRINGAYVHDDATNQVTDVDIVRDMLKSEIESLSGDSVEGFQHSTDEPDEVQITIPTELDDLNDVSIDNNLEDGQVLKYNSTTHKWENSTVGYFVSQSSPITVEATTNTTLVTIPKVEAGVYIVCGSLKINTMPSSNVLRYFQLTMSNGDKICEMTINQAAYATIRIPVSGVVIFNSDTTNVNLIVYLREQLEIAETEIGLMKMF